MQPKWDGFRLLIDIDRAGHVRAWSRHGTSLTARLEPLLACFEAVPADSIFDGELVAIGERESQPAQDFATVTRAVFTGNPAAADRLRFVGFDVLRLGAEDLRDSLITPTSTPAPASISSARRSDQAPSPGSSSLRGAKRSR
jgi:ATP-dependent DNA ligase